MSCLEYKCKRKNNQASKELKSSNPGCMHTASRRNSLCEHVCHQSHAQTRNAAKHYKASLEVGGGSTSQLESKCLLEIQQSCYRDDHQISEERLDWLNQTLLTTQQSPCQTLVSTTSNTTISQHQDKLYWNRKFQHSLAAWDLSKANFIQAQNPHNKCLSSYWVIKI